MNITAKGQNGTVTFDGQTVTIARKGFLAASTTGTGEKRIPLRSIQAVQLKPAGIGQGFISFTVAGGVEKQSRFGRQSFDATKDENSLVFLRKSNADMTAVRDAIEQAIATGSTPATPQATAADQIAAFAELHANGALSDEEFAAAKAKALGL